MLTCVFSHDMPPYIFTHPNFYSFPLNEQWVVSISIPLPHPFCRLVNNSLAMLIPSILILPYFFSF